MTGGQIIGLIFAVFFAIGVLAFCYFLIVKLGKTVDAATKFVSDTNDKTMPLLTEVTQSVTQVNAELVRVEQLTETAQSITSNAQSVTGNVSALTSLFAATLGSPIIKVAAFSYGVRQVASNRQEKDVNKRVREELKSSRKARR